MVQIQKQPMMRRVVYALLPLFLFSFYLYGWRSLTVMAVAVVFGCLSEYVMERILKKKKDVKVTEAFLVTSFLFALSMPPSLGEIQNLWVVAVGIVFGIVFGKMAYGGFGRNVFNPAIAGRLFVFLAFPSILSSGWMLGSLFGFKIVAGVTPLAPLKGDMPSLMSLGLGEGSYVALNLFLGTRAGSLGESSVLLVILGGLYLLWSKTAQLRLMASPMIGAFFTMAGLYYLPRWLGYAPVEGVTHPFYGMMAGSLIFASVFMVTEPVTAPNKPWAQIMYGLLIGILIVIIRTFSLLPESVSFAIIIGNIFASLIDELIPKADMKSKRPDWVIKGLLLISTVLYILSSLLGGGSALGETIEVSVYSEPGRGMACYVLDSSAVTQVPGVVLTFDAMGQNPVENLIV